MRKKRLLWNTVSSLVFQITTIICGFVLPHLILHHFGSSINGLVNSITQFLAVITFLELGVGAVVQSSLYKPLANKDSDTVSKIIVSANKFFRNIARILLVYIVVLVIVYPFITNRSDNGETFSWMYTAALIGAISISSFAQYYFGVVDRLLLTADQRGYIQYTAQTITLILNTVTCAVMINFGASIHMVKLTTSLIFLARPVFLRWYVNRNYSINRKIQYKEEPIKQNEGKEINKPQDEAIGFKKIDMNQFSEQSSDDSKYYTILTYNNANLKLEFKLYYQKLVNGSGAIYYDLYVNGNLKKENFF